MGRKAGSPKTGGRVKGTPNKMTTLAREVIAQAANALGGVDRLVKWAQEDKQNETAFWTKIYPRLVPVQVTAEIIDWSKLNDAELDQFERLYEKAAAEAGSSADSGGEAPTRH